MDEGRDDALKPSSFRTYRLSAALLCIVVMQDTSPKAEPTTEQLITRAIELDAFAKMAPTAQASAQLHKLARHYVDLVGRRVAINVD